eukprot:11409058-Alexandrium_andersonii.AAC.3
MESGAFAELGARCLRQGRGSAGSAKHLERQMEKVAGKATQCRHLSPSDHELFDAALGAVEKNGSGGIAGASPPHAVAAHLEGGRPYDPPPGEPHLAKADGAWKAKAMMVIIGCQHPTDWCARTRAPASRCWRQPPR